MKRGSLRALLAAGVLLLWGGFAGAQDDRGEQGEAKDALALGPDVARSLGPPALAPLRGPALEERADALAHVTRCPVCQGLSVADSPSESARNMQRQIRAMVAAGYDDEQVIGYFETAYGEFVRMVPKPEGFNLLVFVIPGIGLLGGLAVVVRTVRRRSAPAQVAALPAGARQRAADGDEALDPYLHAVKQELSRDG